MSSMELLNGTPEADGGYDFERAEQEMQISGELGRMTTAFEALAVPYTEPVATEGNPNVRTGTAYTTKETNQSDSDTDT